MSDDEIAEMVVQNANEEAAPSEGNETVELHKVEEEVTSEPEAEPGTGEVKEEGETPEQPKKEHENGLQKRINKLVLQRKEAERRAEEAEHRAQEAEGRKRVDQDSQAEPVTDDFENYEDYESALIDHKVGKRLQAERQADNLKRQEAKSREIQTTFSNRVKDANLDGYDEASEALIESRVLQPDIVQALLVDEKGPQMVHYLGNHLDVAEKLQSLSPVQAALELGRISANLSVAKKHKKTTNAPEPVEVLSGGGSLNKSVADMSMEEIYNRK